MQAQHCERVAAWGHRCAGQGALTLLASRVDSAGARAAFRPETFVSFVAQARGRVRAGPRRHCLSGGWVQGHAPGGRTRVLDILTGTVLSESTIRDLVARVRLGLSMVEIALTEQDGDEQDTTGMVVFA